MLNAHLGLGSELIDWSPDATSVPYGSLLIDLTPRTGDRLRYCSNFRSIPSKFYIPDRLKQSNSLDDEHTKSLHSPSVPISFPQMQKSFLQSCPKEFTRFLCECIVNFLHETCNYKKTSRDKISNRSSISLPWKKTTWKQRRDFLASDKGLQLIKVNTPPVISHLFWYGAACSRPCFYVQQQQDFEYSGSYETRASKVSSRTNSNRPNWFA